MQKNKKPLFYFENYSIKGKLGKIQGGDGGPTEGDEKKKDKPKPPPTDGPFGPVIIKE